MPQDATAGEEFFGAGREERRCPPLQGVKGDTGSPRVKENPLKRILLAAVAVVALGAFAAPASADVCYDVSVTLNGETTAAADCVDTP